VELVDWLLEQGAQVQVYDPAVKELPISWANRVKKCVSAQENIEEIQVLVVGTEWPEFIDAANQLPEFVDSNLLIIDANRHLKQSLRETAVAYLSVGSRQEN
jgi:UDPglucose 6-dehydrogenase